MFESIVIKRHESSGEIDPGLLAEALLYYSSVHVILTGGTLKSLLTGIGPDTLLRLLEERRLKATFFADNLGTVTNTNGLGIAYHNFSAFTISGNKDGSKISPRDWAVRQIETTLGKSLETKRFAKNFLAQVPIGFFEKPGQNDKGLCATAREDLKDRSYVTEAAKIILQRNVPTYHLPGNFRFGTFTMPDGSFVVDTNLDYGAINAEYHKTVPISHSSINDAFILSRILDARADIQLAADYMSEFVTDSTNAAVVQRRMNGLFRRRDKSASDISAFQDVVLQDAMALRDVINSGERDFGEFLNVLEKGDKFKEWLRERNADEGLLKEYQRELSKESWFNSLPSRAARFSFFAATGLGLEALLGGTGVATGVALSAADAFLLDRLAKGWKPSQFIEGPVAGFVKIDN